MDEKKQTIQVKGVAYKFAPLDLEAVGRVDLLRHMDVSDAVTVKAVMGLIKKSLGNDDWDELVTRFVSGEVPLSELTVILEKLLKRAAKDADSPHDAG